MSPPAVKNAVTLLGAGTQGRRLAFMWSRRGRPVYLVDIDQEQLSLAWEEIQALRRSKNMGLCRKVEKWGAVILTPATGLKNAMSDSWLAVECVPENLDRKKSIIMQMDNAAELDTIIASNSSSYTIAEILQDLKVRRRDRCVSMHSYWPPETPAIEIMGSGDTRSEIITRLIDETKLHGFQPFHVRRTSTGYIYNRIWAAIKRETIQVVDEGIATPQEVDDIFKSVLKTPKGPCEQMDVVGLDVVLDIENHYAEIREGIPEGPRKFLKRMVAERRLGLKSGRGFYDYGSAS